MCQIEKFLHALLNTTSFAVKSQTKRPYLYVAVVALFAACTPSKLETHYVVPEILTDESKLGERIATYEPHLRGKKIFIDPGHGGEDPGAISPNGVVEEKEANLAVSKFLQGFLERAGARVYMSRVGDETVGLEERAERANEIRADLFVSIHHNAASNRTANYTSTFYHAKEGAFEYEPSNRDVARYIQRDLAYAMRNSGGLGSFDGTYSDYWIYDGAGFSVLRNIDVPGVLVEASFISSDFEEPRLALEEFNRVEAWGIFLGIAKYYAAGFPTIEYLGAEPDDAGGAILLYKLADRTGVDPETIRVFVDGKRTTSFHYEPTTGVLRLPFLTMYFGEHVVRIIVANERGNHARPNRHEIEVEAVR